MVKNKKSVKRTTVIAVVAIILGGALYGALAYTNKWIPFTEDDHSFTVDEQGRGVNPKKTKQEQTDIKTIQNNPAAKTKRPNTDVASPPKTDQKTHKKTVYVLLTSVSQSVDKNTIRASGFVTNSVERAGECTYIFTAESGAKVVKKQTGILQGPSSTACQTIQVAATELGAGAWTVTLEYVSETSHGVADRMKLIVE